MPENNQNSIQNSNGEAERRRLRLRNKAMIIMGITFSMIGFVWLLYWLCWGQFHEYTDDAYVNGNMVQLMSQIPGTVTEINTDDTQWVTEGQVLVKFDPTDMDIALEHAAAELADTVRQVRQLFENFYRAEAALSASKAEFIKAKLDFKRRVSLVGDSAVSHEEYQHYLTAKETAHAQYDVALRNFRSSQAAVANTHIYTHPLVQRAKSNFEGAYLNVKRTVVIAPVTGYVAKRSVQVGQHISINTPMLAIVPLNEVWVDANYKESQLTYMRMGQPASVYADAYPDVTYHGKIYGLNVGTGAAFSLLPPQNATGNWIKIVQRLPVRIVLDPEELKQHPLQLGLSMHVTTSTFHHDQAMMAQAPITKTLYKTNIYAQQIANAHQVIDAILHLNSPDMYIAETNLNV